MQTRTSRTLAAAAALALFTTACTDAPTTPARVPGTAMPALTAADGQPVLVSNSVKYRDQGGKPATGRAGSAVLEALALLSRDGTTTLAVQARHVDPYVSATGEVSKLQLKAFAADGTVRFIRNLHGETGTEPIVLRGVVGGDALAFQANVRGLDGSRTDVVTVTETVKRRPDLQIHLSAPGSVILGMPTVISASVAERNGDVGSRAHCELWVDGQLADNARSIWVDAGDAVSCIFTHTFTAEGNHTVVTRVRTLTSGGDWNDEDNTDSGVVEVHGPAKGDMDFIVSYPHVFQYLDVDSSEYTMRYRNLWNGTGSEEVDRWSSTYGGRYSSIQGFMPRGISGPVQILASQETGGQEVSAVTLSHDTGSERWWCRDWWQGTTAFYICSDPDGTSFQYHDGADRIAYHGYAYSRTWDDAAGTEEYVYHRVSDSDWVVGTFPAMGATYTWRVLVTTTDGRYRAEATVPIVSQHIGSPFKLDCFTIEDPERGFAEDWCQGYSVRSSSWWGDTRTGG